MMDGESQVVREAILDSTCKCLKSIGSVTVAGMRVDMETYISSDEHLLGKIPHIPSVLVGTTAISNREDVLEIRLQKSAIAKVCHHSIGVVFDFLVYVDVILAKPVEEGSAEVGCVGDIGDLLHIGRHREVNQVLDSRKADVFKFGGRHLAKGLSIGPCVPVGNTQQIFESLAIISNR